MIFDYVERIKKNKKSSKMMEDLLGWYGREYENNLWLEKLKVDF